MTEAGWARPAGDAALLLDVPDGTSGPARLAAAITARRLPGVLDVVPAARTVLVITEPGSWRLAELTAAVRAISSWPQPPGSGQSVEIGVCYDGPDLAEVAALTGLAREQVAALHQRPDYVVGWIGFCPGFGYLTGLDPALAAVSRRARPRESVPAGSVAIAGGMTAVYPAATPGGWRIIGRTPAVLWDPGSRPPAMLTAGMRVRFRALRAWPAGDADAPARPAPAVPAGPAFRWAPTGAGGEQPGAAEVVEVLRPGPLATVQDLGRSGYASMGVPPSGAADAASLRTANRLAGNRPGAAGIELTLGRAAFRFLAECRVALAGAAAPVSVSLGAGRVTAAPFGAPVDVPAGAELAVGAPADGLRSYLAIHGGVANVQVLGSRSSDLLSGLGPGPLRAGQKLAVGGDGLAGGGARPGDPPPAGYRERTGAAAAVHRGTRRAGRPGSAPALRVVPGPRLDWLRPGSLAALCSAEYQVTAASNRTALRLEGPALHWAGGGEPPSDGLVTGAVQVPPDGQPILMLADHPVTGGYPVIAVVVSGDIGLAAQLRPGRGLRFAVTQPTPVSR